MRQCLVGPETQRMLELGHPWVIADRYTGNWPPGPAGEVIALVDKRGQPLATALYDPDERIVARVLDRRRISLTAAWLEQRFKWAAQLRRHALLGDTDVYRWVNGEGDGVPGLTLDRYADFLMLQLYSKSWEPHLELLQQAIRKVFPAAGIYRKMRPQETRSLEARSPSKVYSELLSGRAAPAPLTVRENGLHFLVDLSAGLNTGLFPDQRRNRRELMARVAGKRVLNLFAFTGAFSVAAAAGRRRQGHQCRCVGKIPADCPG